MSYTVIHKAKVNVPSNPVINNLDLDIVYYNEATDDYLGIMFTTIDGEDVGIIGLIKASEFTIINETLTEPTFDVDTAIATGQDLLVRAKLNGKDNAFKVLVPNTKVTIIKKLANNFVSVSYNNKRYKISPLWLTLDYSKFAGKFVKVEDKFYYCDGTYLIDETGRSTLIKSNAMTIIKVPKLRLKTDKTNNVSYIGYKNRIAKVNYPVVKQKGMKNKLTLSYLNRKLVTTPETPKPKYAPPIKDVYSDKGPRFDKLKYLGIEFELVLKDNPDKLAKRLIELGVAQFCTITSDASLRDNDGENSRRCVEVRCVVPEISYKRILKNVCQAFEDCGGYVNNSCGTHVHFDMRRRDIETSFLRMVRSQPLLGALVPIERRINKHCLKVPTNVTSIRNWKAKRDSLRTTKRYFAINIDAYDKHQSLEVRLKDGTIEYNDMISWIEIILTVLNTKKAIKTIIRPHTFISKFKPSQAIQDYIKTKVSLHKKSKKETAEIMAAASGDDD